MPVQRKGISTCTVQVHVLALKNPYHIIEHTRSSTGFSEKLRCSTAVQVSHYDSPKAVLYHTAAALVGCCRALLYKVAL
jgi:hypothetical protein